MDIHKHAHSSSPLATQNNVSNYQRWVYHYRLLFDQSANSFLVDVHTLSGPQLAEVQQQLTQEIQHLTGSFQKLQQAQLKFNECKATVKVVSSPENEDKELLVPLTSSLYVPGRIVDCNKVMVDVGTGYFVEKTSKDAIEFFEKKTQTLQENLVDLEKIVSQKSSNLRVIEDTLKQKIAEQQAEKKKAGESS